MPENANQDLPAPGMYPADRNAFKKAVVTLREGDIIDFYSNI